MADLSGSNQMDVTQTSGSLHGLALSKIESKPLLVDEFLGSQLGPHWTNTAGTVVSGGALVIDPLANHQGLPVAPSIKQPFEIPASRSAFLQFDWGVADRGQGADIQPGGFQLGNVQTNTSLYLPAFVNPETSQETGTYFVGTEMSGVFEVEDTGVPIASAGVTHMFRTRFRQIDGTDIKIDIDISEDGGKQYEPLGRVRRARLGIRCQPTV